MNGYSWRVTDDRKWAEVRDIDGELVARFRDDEKAADYVAWLNETGQATTRPRRQWVCNFFQKAKPTDTLCGVCDQSREAHIERDRSRG